MANHDAIAFLRCASAGIIAARLAADTGLATLHEPGYVRRCLLYNLVRAVASRRAAGALSG